MRKTAGNYEIVAKTERELSRMKQFYINFFHVPGQKRQILPFLRGRKWQEKCAKKSPAAWLQGIETKEFVFT